VTSISYEQHLKNKKGEILVYAVIWLIVLLMPFFLSYNSGNTNWRKIIHEWIRISPFLLVFLVHNFLLFPVFFKDRKYFFYTLTTLLLSMGASILIVILGREIFSLPLPESMQNLPGMPGLEPHQNPRPRTKESIFLDNVLISILVVGFNAAIKLTIKSQEQEQKNKELEKQKLQSELAFLKNQVSPHFFMNTLNNIHALIDVNAENAKESIIKLSKLMRYLLYDSEHGKTMLKKEIEFIKNYVDLMRLRFSSKVKIELSFPESIPDVKIPPMLFTSLVENAFKHGVSYQTESFIGVYLRILENDLVFRIVNSVSENSEVIEKGGLGLKNLRKRLELIYGSRFELDSSEDESVFEVNIKIPLNGN